MSLLEGFLVQCDEVIWGAKKLKEVDLSTYNDLALEAEKHEIESAWTECKDNYKKCISDPECMKKNKETIRNKKREAQDCYIDCVRVIGEFREKAKISQAPTPTTHKLSSSISVPPCDTEVFQGDYVSWPSFRDLFTAIYLNNKKLSPVEKLYHLFQKTSGEAREINRQIPLTAEGFEIAWSNLKNQYENKRILINNQ